MKNWPSVDQLIVMAEKYPEALEAFRLQEVENLITSAPEEMQRRLRGLQFQIDCQRQLHPTPISACIAISKMMHESVARLQKALHGVDPEDVDGESEAFADRGRVLPFPATAG